MSTITESRTQAQCLLIGAVELTRRERIAPPSVEALVKKIREAFHDDATTYTQALHDRVKKATDSEFLEILEDIFGDSSNASAFRFFGKRYSLKAQKEQLKVMNEALNSYKAQLEYAKPQQSGTFELASDAIEKLEGKQNTKGNLEGGIIQRFEERIADLEDEVADEGLALALELGKKLTKWIKKLPTLNEKSVKRVQILSEFGLGQIADPLAAWIKSLPSLSKENAEKIQNLSEFGLDWLGDLLSAVDKGRDWWAGRAKLAKARGKRNNLGAQHPNLAIAQHKVQKIEARQRKALLDLGKKGIDFAVSTFEQAVKNPFTLAKYAIPSAASVIIYSTWSLQNSGFFSIQSATAILVTSISVTLIIGTGWVALLFKRTRVDVHPNGITIQGVINRVTLDNTTNCIMVQQSALGDTGYGTLYVNRASGKKCRVWNDFIDVELDNLVLSTLPKIRANVHDKPNRDIAPYVSLNHKISSGHLAVVMYVIILIITSTLML